ncbi:acyl-CoA thioester hydrolase [Paenibacillus sp. UNCCL117]|uniref:acyl-CoA thioesterase n=2 Tax=unclassified Paenibacillus TaxID=185978 RepID=UPI00088FF155|nr:thioesterase family protein [Paenibacillus sp. UNCCL117]SDC08890.1 acyl-CoA thioester hydrolase [Paenibacillus sp. cl123]SFW38350.1 acyl-CoA thioester hydrolase [Paenibacillus sp. UNCCL117]
MWHNYEIRVRYQETDQMGVVYHANYLTWLEIGRTEMIRELGIPYERLEAQGLLLPVLEADLKFRQPARYDDRVTVYTRLESLTPMRLHFAYEVKRDDDLLVAGATRHVWVNRSWKPVRLDREAPAVYALLTEAGSR